MAFQRPGTRHFRPISCGELGAPAARADKVFAFTRRFPYTGAMQSQNPLLDELTKAANAAVGLAQAAGEEAKAAFRSGVDRVAADIDLIRREEFEALKAEIASLRAEVATLKQAGEG